MKKSLLSILGGISLVLAPKVQGDTLQQKDTLVAYQSTDTGEYQRSILEEVKKRYGDSASYVELSPNFPKEIIEESVQQELIKNNGVPERVLIVADHRSLTPESVKTANRWVRDLDEDPFPDAKIAFFPTHPDYVKELTKLIHRSPYETTNALTRLDDQVISFAREGVNVNHRTKTLEVKKDGKIEVKRSKDQSKDYLDAANSGDIDYIARFGHSGPGFWQSTDLMNSFWLVGMNGETLLVNPGTSALKSRKIKDKFVGEINLENLIKRDRIKKYPRVGSDNPKILDNYACCNAIVPCHKVGENEFSTIISNMVGNNAYVWGYENEVAFVPQAGAHQLLFWGSNGANSFTDSLLGSTIFVTSQRERLEREGEKGLEYQIVKADELCGMFFGLPDDLTRASVSNRMYDQELTQEKVSGKLNTKLNLEIKAPTQVNDYRMRMWSPPVIILKEKIDPFSIRNAELEIDGNGYELKIKPQKGYITADIPDRDMKGEITFVDNALVLGIAPIELTREGELRFKYKDIKRDQKISLSFESQ